MVFAEVFYSFVFHTFLRLQAIKKSINKTFCYIDLYNKMLYNYYAIERNKEKGGFIQ